MWSTIQKDTSRGNLREAGIAGTLNKNTSHRQMHVFLGRDEIEDFGDIYITISAEFQTHSRTDICTI